MKQKHKNNMKVQINVACGPHGPTPQAIEVSFMVHRLVPAFTYFLIYSINIR